MHAITLMAAAAFTIQFAAFPERSTAQAPSTAAFTITDVSNDPVQHTRYFKVTSSADVDGDGRPDSGLLRISCAEDKVSAASYRYHEWRWTGSASAKRVENPSPDPVANWAAAGPELQAMKVGYDLKKNEKARTAPPTPSKDEWSPVTLSAAAGLCGGAARAVNLNSSRSN